MQQPGALDGFVRLFGRDGDLDGTGHVEAPGAGWGRFVVDVWGVQGLAEGFLGGICGGFASGGMSH